MATKKAPASAEKKAATKTTKAPAKRAVAAKTAVAAVHEKKAPTYAEVAQLAERFWIERGRPDGSPEVDWLRAEETLYA